MLKYILFSILFSSTLVHAQSEQGRPPIDQSDVTSSDALLKRSISSHIKNANTAIKKCSEGTILDNLDFMGIYTTLSSKVKELAQNKKQESKNCNDCNKINPPSVIEVMKSLAKKEGVIDKKAVAEDKFFKCLLNKDFDDEVSKIVKNKSFITVVAEKNKISRKKAREIRKFYEQLIEVEIKK